jgi:hypothetical protein
VTRDRVSALVTALASYIDNAERHGRAPTFLVVDDSPAPELAAGCRERIRRLASERGVRVAYASHRDKRAFARRLRDASGVPDEVVHFALLPDSTNSVPAYGANRNALLLHTAGEMLLSVDDDTQCRVHKLAASEEGVACAVGRDPSELWAFPSRDVALAAVTPDEQDILAAHETLLGRPVRSLVTPERDAESHTTVVPSLSQRVAAHDVTVAMTFNGLVGDCGWGAPFGWWGGPLGYLIVNDDSHSRLVHSEAAYRSACITREIVRVVKRPTVSDTAFAMTTFVGLDNRRLLPPYMPIHRGEDAVFGQMLWACFPEYCAGHIPWMLVHAPSGSRRFWPGEMMRTATAIDAARLVLAVLEDGAELPARARLANGRDRLTALGELLGVLGSMAPSRFESRMRGSVRRQAGRIAAHLDRCVHERGGSAAWWAEDVRRYLRLLKTAAGRDDYWVPLDLVGRAGGDVREGVQRFFRNLGALLVWWPTLVAVASGLRTGNEPLAHEVA